MSIAKEVLRDDTTLRPVPMRDTSVPDPSIRVTAIGGMIYIQYQGNLLHLPRQSTPCVRYNPEEKVMSFCCDPKEESTVLYVETEADAAKIAKELLDVLKDAPQLVEAVRPSVHVTTPRPTRTAPVYEEPAPVAPPRPSKLPVEEPAECPASSFVSPTPSAKPQVSQDVWRKIALGAVAGLVVMVFAMLGFWALRTSDSRPTAPPAVQQPSQATPWTPQ